MEKGQSFGSADELQERRKKKGALPLAVFLSFNDRDVNPQCPNARNPYHKCGWHCLDKIPGGNMLLDLERSGGSSSEWENMSERKVVNPTCPNASNPYHKCAEYCFAKNTGKPQDAVKEPVQIKGEKMVHRKDVTPISLKALDFFHKHAEYCLRGNYTNYQGKNKGVVITGDESAVNPNCKHASNPYHRCDKFCFENSPVSDLRKGVLKPNEQKLVRAADRGVNPECRYASNPYHVCSEYCFQKAPERVQAGQAMNPKNLKERKKIVNKTERTGVNPNCRFASNPYHKCSEYCFQNVAERDISDGVAKSEGKKAVNDAERRDGKPKREKTSNPYPVTDNCFPEIIRDNPAVEAPIKDKNSGQQKERKADHRMIETRSQDSDVFIKEDKEASMIELLDSQPLRIDAAELFKEWAKYCSLKASEDNEAKTGKTDQR